MKCWAAWTLPLLAAAQAHAQEAPPPSGSQTGVLGQEEVLLFEVTLDNGTLTDALQVYNLPAGMVLPVGELARLLDLNVDVRPRERRIVGRIGSQQRSLLVDLATGTARIDNRNLDLPPGSAIAGLTDIYLTRELVEQLLPLQIAVDAEALAIALTATEKLPIQSKLERLGRLRELQPEVSSREEVFWVPSAPGLLSVPAFDVALETSLDADKPRFRRRYDVRVGADAFYSGFQGYIGSDEQGRPTSTRLLFERRDLEGDLLGPVEATRLSVGDTFAPSVPMGARSIGGRGISISTAALEQTSVFDRVDLRGELPIGFDVELYVNDVLRGGQETPVQGRYEFLDVPLVRGVNVIRIVSYGPRGERFEDTRVVNVAGGALPKGKLTFEFGAVEQETPLLDLRRSGTTATAPGEGQLRISAAAGYGLTDGLTLVGGAAVYTPGERGERKLGTLGFRTSLFGYAMQADAGYDDGGGTGLSLGVAGNPLGVSTILRHAEYRGGFIDEELPMGSEGRELERHSEATMDFSVGVAELTFPLSVRAQRDEFADGRTLLIGSARVSTTTNRLLLSAGFDYSLTKVPTLSSLDRLTGTLSASTFSAGAWQLRGTLDYDVLPEFKARSAAVTADREISKFLAMRVGAGRAFIGDRDTTIQAASIFRLPFGDLSITGDYTAPRDDYRIGLQMAFGLAFDPFRRRFAMTRPGAGVGGNAALQAFIDRDADDRYDPAIDEPVPNVVVTSGANEATTDARGRALVTGLGYGATARLQVDLDGIDNPYVVSPSQTVEFTPRVGAVARVLYPLKPVGEVLARVQFRDSSGRMTGLSAVKVRAVPASGKPVDGATEFDGTIVFERLAAGRYRFELDEAQASRLGMRLVKAVEFEVPADGGFIPDVVATVGFDERAAASTR